MKKNKYFKIPKAIYACGKISKRESDSNIIITKDTYIKYKNNEVSHLHLDCYLEKKKTDERVL